MTPRRSAGLMDPVFVPEQLGDHRSTGHGLGELGGGPGYGDKGDGVCAPARSGALDRDAEYADPVCRRADDGPEIGVSSGEDGEGFVGANIVGHDDPVHRHR